MFEILKKACQETRNDDLMTKITPILEKHSPIVENICFFLKTQSLSDIEFNQKLVDYLKDIEDIAAIAQEMQEKNCLTPEYIAIALQNLDTLKIIYAAFQQFEENNKILNEFHVNINTKKTTNSKNSQNNLISIIKILEQTAKNAENFKRNLSDKYGISYFSINIKSCLKHTDTLKEIFQRLEKAETLDDEHILTTAVFIDKLSSAIDIIRKNPLLSSEYKKKTISFIIQTPTKNVLDFIKILDYNNLLSADNLDRLLEKASVFPFPKFSIGVHFPTEYPSDHISVGLDLDQEIYQAILNNPKECEQICDALKQLYTHYKFIPTNEEEFPSNFRGAAIAYMQSVKVTNPDAVKQRILDAKEKAKDQFTQDKKWICQYPQYAETLIRIMTQLRQANIQISQKQIQSLCNNGQYIKTVFVALRALNPPTDRNELIFLNSVESISGEIRNPTKENQLTQAIFDEIAKNPRSAMLIAYDHGIQMFDGEREDYLQAEKIGTALGAATEKPENKLPANVAQLIGFWACENKLDHGSRDEVLLKNLDNSAKLSQSQRKS